MEREQAALVEGQGQPCNAVTGAEGDTPLGHIPGMAPPRSTSADALRESAGGDRSQGLEAGVLEGGDEEGVHASRVGGGGVPEPPHKVVLSSGVPEHADNTVAGLLESWTGPAPMANTPHPHKEGSHLPKVPGHVEKTAENSVFGLLRNWVVGEPEDRARAFIPPHAAHQPRDDSGGGHSHAAGAAATSGGTGV